jgi:molybdenum cofactor cytidylyltransferase
MPDLSVGADKFVGILLAAGKGARFDPTGAKNKLLQTLDTGELVVVASARNLRAALPDVIAVVRPGAAAVARELQTHGCEVTECSTAENGMGESLVHALSRAPHAAGWVIALGDMPFVQPATIATLVQAIRDGADIAVPAVQGRRGNPVAFSRVHLPRLLELNGDQGARSLLKACPVREVVVDDRGILRDIDSEADLSPSG